MAERNEYTPDTFCWVDLATTDAAAARQFYTALFDWEADDVPAGDAGSYTMMRKNGRQVCGLFGMASAMKEKGVPPSWMSYVSVTSADDSAAKVGEFGGTIIQPPFDVMKDGRMAVVKDPDGAVFSLWEARANIGAQIVNEPDTWCWNEVYSNNIALSRKFYADVFNWTTKVDDSSGEGEYYEWQLNGRSHAGLLKIQPDWGAVPPNWAVYFLTDNLKAKIDKAVDLGGTIIYSHLEISGTGSFGLLKDPQGAVFNIFQPAA